jgi:hypothetical protein
MSLYRFNQTCPNCDRKIELCVETADGIPRETEAECECGKIPVFAVLWTPDIWIEGFDHYYEPSNNAVHLTPAAMGSCDDNDTEPQAQVNPDR